ncbi:hypothetical protein [Nostoc sp. FACHB-888]|uniref:hypothetical protein n=1 Tax=Nostoc sp. FACHB-888 TaxID=2692842 RepID=UPI0016825FB7|nr:hypothetical protein [Nostoc sp. FACHB-888]MBD2248161.1 hypothetical protein [Nostoc sp. FACHB-888]
MRELGIGSFLVETRAIANGGRLRHRLTCANSDINSDINAPPQSSLAQSLLQYAQSAPSEHRQLLLRYSPTLKSRVNGSLLLS